MDLPLVIIFLGSLIFCAHFFNALFSVTKIPNVLLLLIIGILIGPVLGFVKPHHFGEVGPVFTTITLIILLFESGTNLKIGDLVKSIGSAFFLTLFNFIASAVIATLVARFLTSDLDWVSATFFGVIVAGTSSAVVIPIVKQLKMNEKGETILLLESALSDVLCLVIGLALLAGMRKGVVELTEILNTIWKSFLIAGGIGFAAGLVWSVLLHRVRALQNSIFTHLAFVLIVYGFVEWLGLNGGIATLICGITLGNAYLLQGSWVGFLIPSKPLQLVEKTFFAELVFILMTYFFVYVGVNIKFGAATIYVLALLIVVGIILARPFSIKFFVRSKMPIKDLTIMSIMAPKGLVPAILASIPLQYGLAGAQNIQDLAYAVVLLSILICAILVIVISKNPLAITFVRNTVRERSTDDQMDEAIEGAAADGTEVEITESTNESPEGSDQTGSDGAGGEEGTGAKPPETS